MSVLSALLEDHPQLDRYIRPRVADAVAGMQRGTRPSRADLAGACLGNSYQTVRSLLADGVVSGHLEDLAGERHAFVDQGVLETYIDLLGLPRGRTAATSEPPRLGVPQYGLFPHQIRAVRRLRGLLHQRGLALLHMPTGAGKTRTVMNLVCDEIRGSDKAILWLASTHELCEQAAHEFSRAWQHLGNREVPIHAIWGGRRWKPEQIRSGLAIATPQALYSRYKREGGEFAVALGDGVSLIVFDEAHQIIAPTYESVVLNLRASGNNTPVVGLSATPGRTFEGNDADRRLASFFEGNKVLLDTGAEGDSNPVRYLISNQYLAEPDFRLLTPEGLAASGEYVDASLYDPEDNVELRMDPTEYVRLVADTAHKLVAEGHRRILVFAASVLLSEDVAAALLATGVLAESVHGGTEPEMRAAAIERYRADSKTPRILVNYGVLTTGFDAPQTSAAIIARPTRSLVLYSQMLGRAIRGKKQGGNEKATVVTVVDPEVPAFGSIADAFLHWEDNWE
jgi:DNA repair protein RadD